MMNFIYVLCAAVLVFLAYKYNILIGLAITALIAGYVVYVIIPLYYEMKANKAYENADFAEAKRWMKKAYDTKRMKVKARVSYAYILLRTGDADEAEAVLDKIIRTRNLKPEQKNLAKQQRCMVYYKQGRLDEALEEAYEIFDGGNYQNTTLYGMIGYFKLIKDDEDALDFCLEAYEYNDEDRDIIDNLSICYYKLGQYDKAKELSDKIIATNTKFVEAYYHGAQIAVKCGDFQLAKEYIDKIPDCRWSEMTTVTRDEVAELEKEVKEKL